MLKVLIVEDDTRIRNLISAYLKKENYDITEAIDGIDAIEKFKKGNFHVVILDLMLPKLDGTRVCRKIRETSLVHIIMLTAKSQEEDKLQGYDYGADDYMTKPFSPKELVAKIKAVSTKINTQVTTNDEINYEYLKIKLPSKEVKVHGNIIDLTPKEYDLLVYLCTNHSIVLSRELILEKVWGYDYEGDIRVVDTTIKRLRHKLDGCNYITTVRGSGYKFEV